MKIEGNAPHEHTHPHTHSHTHADGLTHDHAHHHDHQHGTIIPMRMTMSIPARTPCTMAWARPTHMPPRFDPETYGANRTGHSAKNNTYAHANRRWFDEHGIFCPSISFPAPARVKRPCCAKPLNCSSMKSRSRWLKVTSKLPMMPNASGHRRRRPANQYRQGLPP